MNNSRYYELDSLRGIAAFSVLLSHFLLILPLSGLTKFIEYGPLRIFIAGEEAVPLFFILSGFVLSLPFYKNKNVSYIPFITKRILRIYAPYYMSLLIAVILLKLTYNGNIESLSSWFNNIWANGISVKLIVEHILLIGSFPNATINPVLWSLVHEMRISLIFPLITYLVIRLSWKKVISLCVTLSLISWGGYTLFHMSDYGTIYDISLTVHFISLFIIGAMLAKYRVSLIEKMRLQRFNMKMLIFFLALSFYLYVKPAMLLKIFLHSRDPIIANILDTYCITIGAAVLIILSLSSKRFSDFLLLRPLRFLGEISYSLYLYHSIVLLTITHLFYNSTSLWVIWAISLLGSLLISSISYYFIEVPSIRLGKRLFFNGNRTTVDHSFVLEQKIKSIR